MICWLISCLCLPWNRGSPTKPVSLKIVSLSFCLRRKKRDGNIWDHRVHCWIATIEASHMWNRPLHSSSQHSHAQDFLGQPHGPLYNNGLQAKAQAWSWFLLHLIHQILSDSPPTHILNLSAVCLPVTSTLHLVTYGILLAFFLQCAGNIGEPPRIMWVLGTQTLVFMLVWWAFLFTEPSPHPYAL